MKLDKKKLRKEFKEAVFKRDGFKCMCCDTVCTKKTADELLDAHHITDRRYMPNGGYVKENGISLCKEKCHINAEKFHITQGKKWKKGMHPKDLYNKIGSSKEMAIKASLDL